MQKTLNPLCALLVRNCLAVGEYRGQPVSISMVLIFAWRRTLSMREFRPSRFTCLLG